MLGNVPPSDKRLLCVFEIACMHLRFFFFPETARAVHGDAHRALTDQHGGRLVERCSRRLALAELRHHSLARSRSRGGPDAQGRVAEAHSASLCLRVTRAQVSSPIPPREQCPEHPRCGFQGHVGRLTSVNQCLRSTCVGFELGNDSLQPRWQPAIAAEICISALFDVEGTHASRRAVGRPRRVTRVAMNQGEVCDRMQNGAHQCTQRHMARHRYGQGQTGRRVKEGQEWERRSPRAQRCMHRAWLKLYSLATDIL